MAALSLGTLAAAVPSGAYTGNADRQVTQKPLTSGTYAYGVFGPNESDFPQVGEYIYGDAGDPIFGGRVRRITNEFEKKPSNSDIYSKNGFWSADGRLMFHNTDEKKTIIDTATGASFDVDGAYKGFDGSFAPVEDKAGIYTWYYLSGSMLGQYKITPATGATGAVVQQSTVMDFKAFRARALGGLGGSVDWIDNSGQYMVLNLDGKVRVWNKHKNSLYAGSVGATGADWIGISPDGKYVVTATNKGFYSYTITHNPDGTGTLSTKGILFWTLCGSHGDLVTASDGKTYLVTFDCYGEAAPYDKPAVYAVHVAPTTSVSGKTASSRAAQRTPNKRLFDVAWGDDGHFSGVSRGVLRNWAFISIESAEDTFGRAVNNWWNRPYMQEIVMVNVVTSQVLRVAHHRSRSVSDSYYYQPRVSANWGDCDGATAGWLSNFGQLDDQGQPYAGYADVYAVDVAAGEVPATGANATTPCP